MACAGGHNTTQILQPKGRANPPAKFLRCLVFKLAFAASFWFVAEDTRAAACTSGETVVMEFKPFFDYNNESVSEKRDK
jgi:hypothetical protein